MKEQKRHEYIGIPIVECVYRRPARHKRTRGHANGHVVMRTDKWLANLLNDRDTTTKRHTNDH